MATFVYSITTTGADGSATGTITTEPLSGFLEAVKLDYHASAPGTTDVTLTETSGLERAVLTEANNATDKIIYPSVAVAGGTDVRRRIVLDATRLTIAVADCNALAPAVTVYIQVSLR